VTSPSVLELRFKAPYSIDEPGEVALEDYARVLTKAVSAEGLRDPADTRMITGVRLLGLDTAPTEALFTDLEDFARGLVSRTAGAGLGWG
jgi:hypothetical protein